MSLSTKKYIVFLHNDIVIAPQFLENILKHLNEKNVVSYTVIEPPLFGNPSTGKIIKNFGYNIELFDYTSFYDFCKTRQLIENNKISCGASFFMALEKNIFIKMGGFDTLFNPMFAEDIDFIWRLELQNIKLITSCDALCYHFVSKTSRFSEEYKHISSEIEYRSNKNFVRKWGSTLKGPKYLTSLIVENCSYELLELMEPWCNNIYINKNLSNLYVNYLKQEQKYTKFNLINKLHTYDDIKQIKSKDSILIMCDGNKINKNNFQLLAKLPSMIEQTNKIGHFKLDIYTVYVKNLIDCRQYVI